MRTKDQFAQALRSSIEAGYPLVLNVMTCCNGCTTDADVAKAYDKQAKEFDLPVLSASGRLWKLLPLIILQNLFLYKIQDLTRNINFFDQFFSGNL